MKGISKHRTGTSALAAASAFVLAAGLMLPQTFAFATDGDEATQAPAATEDATATTGESAVGENAAAADYNFDTDFWFLTGGSDFVIDLRNGGSGIQEIDPVKRLVEAGQAGNYTIDYEFFTEGVVAPTADNTAIQAVSPGYTYFMVTATSNIDPTIYRSLVCTVWVLGDASPALSSFEATVGGSKEVAIDVFDAAAAVDFAVNEGAAYEVSAASSNNDVATVSTGMYETNFGTIYALAPGTATITFTATDLLDPSNVKTASIEVTVTNDVIPNHPEPWDEEGNLLPYAINDGVMTFPGNDKLGEWYRLSLDVDDSVESLGILSGGVSWTMTIPSSSLDPSDPDYRPTEEGLADGPFYIRGNNGGLSSSLIFRAKNPDEMLSVQLEPANAGTAYMAQPNVWAIQLNQPATLKVSTGDSTNISIGSDSGAILSVNVDSMEDASLWSNALEFFADEFVGEIPAGAFEAMEALHGKATNTASFDLRLIDRYTGDVFEIPEGTSVTVSLPIPDDWEIGDVRLFHVADDGTITDMNATVDAEARMLTFTTDHFSIFMMANYPKALSAGEGTGQVVEDAGQVVEDAGQIVDGAEQPGEGLAATGDPMMMVAGAAAAAVVVAAGVGFAASRKGRSQR